jgi:Protein of unknown function DUF45/AAA ATPase domain
LQGVAEPNSVVIAESTRKLLGNLFELEDLGAQDLKGMSGPLRAWVALRPASVESRFEAMHASALTELVGREEELELLLRRWSRAKTGEGQVVLLSGEPGIGKSRLTAALMDRLAGVPHTRLRYFCSPQHTDSALYPIISQMERAAGLTHDDGAYAKLDKLDVVLAQTSTSIENAALFAEMLSLPNDGRYPVLALDPQQRRQRTLEALTGQVEALSRQKPVLIILADDPFPQRECECGRAKTASSGPLSPSSWVRAGGEIKGRRLDRRDCYPMRWSTNGSLTPAARLKRRVDAWAVKLRVMPRTVRVQRMTRKWGSCSTTGTITLAIDLDDEREGFQDFVIVHELLHLKVPNHGRLFKALMTAHIPKWRAFDASRHDSPVVSPKARAEV